MKNYYTKVFRNPVSQDVIDVFNVSKEILNRVSSIKSKLELIGNPKITVVGVETQSDKKRTIHIGVARCTPTDDFNKEDGMVYAAWRANNEPQISLQLPSTATKADVITLFNKIADTLNKRFIDKSNNHFLPALPPSILEDKIEK